MAPNSILITRHAEKPNDPHDPRLSAAGKARAKKLAAFIPDHFGAPDFIVASADSRYSKRTRRTMRPLSKAIGVPIDTTIATNEYAALAHKLLNKAKYDGSLVLICWHHGDIPPLLHALSLPDGSYPKPWDRNVFNLIIEVKLGDDGRPQVQEVTEPF